MKLDQILSGLADALWALFLVMLAIPANVAVANLTSWVDYFSLHGWIRYVAQVIALGLVSALDVILLLPIFYGLATALFPNSQLLRRIARPILTWKPWKRHQTH